ncbi:lyase family protein [Enterobacter hormaechei]
MKNAIDYLDAIVANFNEDDATRIKTIERTTNHDVKAVEYFLKEKVASIPALQQVSEFIHFACNLKILIFIPCHHVKKQHAKKCYYQHGASLLILSVKWRKHIVITLLSRTHAQPATPSTVGKEFANVAYRMERQYRQLTQVEILGKINGAVGNYNAHLAAYPEVDWHQFSEEFVTSLGLHGTHILRKLSHTTILPSFLIASAALIQF